MTPGLLYGTMTPDIKEDGSMAISIVITNNDGAKLNVERSDADGIDEVLFEFTDPNGKATAFALKPEHVNKIADMMGY